MFDNSRSLIQAFALVRAQRKNVVLFDARDSRYQVDPDLRAVSAPRLENIVGPLPVRRAATERSGRAGNVQP